MSILYELLAASLIMLGQNFLGWALHAANQVRLFIQFHDMAHFSFFTDANLNKLFGRLIGIYVHFPF
jgi:fatty acid desaturase